jgi:phosphopantothenoylcysteine decarboxylase/phosphopantothenate--cysteine ligase
MLEGTNVALGVTGSIAAVKIVELAHELRRQGAEVRGVMTDNARGIIHPWSVQFGTDNDVVTELTGRVEHVELCGRDGWADVLLVAPCTANTVGKIGGAVDDTPVTTCATTALGADVPVVIAPAMHEPMYDHPGVLEAIERLESWGVSFVDPRLEEGKAKIADSDAIATEVARASAPQTLAGEHIVVSAGATSESIDPIRTITNRASGKTGRAIARACYVRGADVTLVHDGADVSYADVRDIESASEMLNAVLAAIEEGADAFVSAAAVSDFTVDQQGQKIKSGGELKLDLWPTPKLIDSVREEHPDLVIVGFKAETEGGDEQMVSEARRIRDRVDLAFVVANEAEVMGKDETRTLFVREEDYSGFRGSKVELGERIAEELGDELGEDPPRLR